MRSHRLRYADDTAAIPDTASRPIELPGLNTANIFDWWPSYSPRRYYPTANAMPKPHAHQSWPFPTTVSFLCQVFKEHVSFCARTGAPTWSVVMKMTAHLPGTVRCRRSRASLDRKARSRGNPYAAPGLCDDSELSYQRASGRVWGQVKGTRHSRGGCGGSHVLADGSECTSTGGKVDGHQRAVAPVYGSLHFARSQYGGCL